MIEASSGLPLVNGTRPFFRGLLNADELRRKGVISFV